MANLLDKAAATTYKDTTQQVDTGTDTVYGQLDKYADQEGSLMKRAASKANEVSASRGLTNSTIAVGNAQGAVLDRIGEFAKADAEIYNARKTVNTQAETQLEDSRMGNETSILNARENNATQESISDKDRAAAKDNLLTEIGSREKIANLDREGMDSRLEMELDARSRESGLDRAASERNLLLELQSRKDLSDSDLAMKEKLTQMDIDAKMKLSADELQVQIDLTLKELNSRERIAGKQIEAEALRAELERANKVKLQKMDEQSKVRLENIAQNSQNMRQRYESLDDAWNNLQNGLAQIDPKASKSSQVAQFNRLMESFEARMSFTNSMGGYTPDGSTQQAPIESISAYNDGTSKPTTSTSSTQTPTSSGTYTYRGAKLGSVGGSSDSNW